MNDSIRLGRIAGIRIGLNWSVLALAGLLIWSLGSVFFPDRLPESGAALHWSLAVIATVIALVSILLHEIGHALQARRDGMRIDGITLWMFGGVARFRGQFPSAGAEFRIAIAGPLVSLALAFVFLGALALPGPDAAGELAFWLAYINGALFLFNLLPALPLDGGRILRSILWQVTGDYARGTRIAAKIAQGLAWVLIAFGGIMFIQFGALSGIWLVLIAWFLFQAARAETRALVSHKVLGDLRVRDVMTRSEIELDITTPATEFVDLTIFSPRGASYPVLAGGLLVGVASPATVAGLPREAWSTLAVGDVMRPIADVPVVEPDDLLAEAAAQLRGGLDRIPVAVDGALVGVVTVGALARALGARAREAAAS
jgi:Zn-dependent protease